MAAHAHKGRIVSRRSFARLGVASLGALCGMGLAGCATNGESVAPTAPTHDETTPVPEEQNSMGHAFDLSTRRVTFNDGQTMPLNGLGTYSLHGDTLRSSIYAALSCGTRLIDTASAYENETEVGQAIHDAIDEGIVRREDVFVTTKIYPGAEMADPERSIQACLDRLDLEYVDLMLLHHPDPNDVAAYKAMERFAANGKIRSLGLSCYYIDELTSFLPQVDVTPALVQNEMHPYYQDTDVMRFIQGKGIVTEAWYPLGGRPYDKELLADPVLVDIGSSHGVSAAQVVLRWHLQRHVVVIPGSGNPDHVAEDAELYHFELSQEEMERIGALNKDEKHDWY